MFIEADRNHVTFSESTFFERNSLISQWEMILL